MENCPLINTVRLQRRRRSMRSLYSSKVQLLIAIVAFAVLSGGDALAQDNKQYFEKGTLRFTATDNDGWASVETWVYRWNDEKRDWIHVDGGRTSNGKRDYSLRPGVYKLSMSYREASPNESRSIFSDLPGILSPIVIECISYLFCCVIP